MLNRLLHQLPPLSYMVDDIGSPSAADLARALDVKPASMRRWLRDDAAPRPVMLALFWLTRWGHSIVDADAHNAAVLHAGMVRALRTELDAARARLERLGRIADFGSANDPAPGVARPARPAPGEHAETCHVAGKPTARTKAS